VTQELIS